MRFIWEDGHTREIEIGRSVVGLTHGNARPKYVVVSIDEMEHACSTRKLAMRPYLRNLKGAVIAKEIYLR